MVMAVVETLGTQTLGVPAREVVEGLLGLFWEVWLMGTLETAGLLLPGWGLFSEVWLMGTLETAGVLLGLALVGTTLLGLALLGAALEGAALLGLTLLGTALLLGLGPT